LSLFAQYKIAFDRDGFVVVRQLLAPVAFAELCQNVERFRSTVASPSEMQHLALDRFFRDYVRHPTWRGLAEALLGEEASARAPDWFHKPPGSDHVTPPHQDNYYFNLKPPSVVTLWMALDEVDRENGCLRYVPGSHRRGIRPHGRSNVPVFTQAITDYGPADEAREIAVSVHPGDVVAHHCETIHRADANRSRSRDRRALAMIFTGVSCRRRINLTSQAQG
jgi:phytanoyl-CoA hydroxylase